MLFTSLKVSDGQADKHLLFDKKYPEAQLKHVYTVVLQVLQP